MNKIADHFRPGSNPRGEETRQRILDRAMEAFAAHGFEGVSTRALAREAEVKLPAIQYYFGSKEGLFRAVADHVSAQMERRMAPAAARVEAALVAGEPGPAELRALLRGLMDALIEMAFAGDRQTQRRLFFLRAEIEGSPGLEHINQCVLLNILRPCRALVARLLGRTEEDEQATLRTLMLIGQVVILCNLKAQKVLGWTSRTPGQVRTVQETIAAQIEAGFPAGGEDRP